MNVYSCFRPFLMRMDAEKAHQMTLKFLRTGFGPVCSFSDPILKIGVLGKEFGNPLGLAAGFDKDAEVLGPMLGMGFGFVEAGTVTPRPQPGNPRPRVFRDVPNRSVLNRMGFPGKGVENFARNLKNFRAARKGIIGVNIGINKDAAAPADEYRRGIEALAPLADYIVINVSSPNTTGLRNLQAYDALDKLLTGLVSSAPLLLKVAPDLDAAQRADIAGLAATHGLSGLVIANTTTARPPTLSSALKDEAGGLSGALLRGRATETLRDFYRLTDGKIPLIGVGGIASAEDAYERILAGASLVQLYTGLVFEGPSLIPRILTGLAECLRRDGFASVAQAVGAGQAVMKEVSWRS